jgi:hypothetical protein
LTGWIATWHKPIRAYAGERRRSDTGDLPAANPQIQHTSCRFQDRGIAECGTLRPTGTSAPLRPRPADKAAKHIAVDACLLFKPVERP